MMSKYPLPMYYPYRYKISSDDLEQVGEWLRTHAEYGEYTFSPFGEWLENDTVIVWIEKAEVATLFKLTFGGVVPPSVT